MALNGLTREVEVRVPGTAEETPAIIFWVGFARHPAIAG
jgi:hypothetical protein